MHNYQYVSTKKAAQAKKDVISLIHLVQNEVRDKFTFSYEFIGSASRKMITYDPTSNIGFDFDVNLRVNDDWEEFSPKEIKQILSRGINKHSKQFDYDFCEDSKRVITIKVKDRENSKILHSCDFAIVMDYIDDEGCERQKYIHYDKKKNTYEWQEQPEGFYKLQEKIEWCKDNGIWQSVRNTYLQYKRKNNDPNRKSRHLFNDAVHSACQKNGYYDYHEDNMRFPTWISLLG